MMISSFHYYLSLLVVFELSHSCVEFWWLIFCSPRSMEFQFLLYYYFFADGGAAKTTGRHLRNLKIVSSPLDDYNLMKQVDVVDDMMGPTS